MVRARKTGNAAHLQKKYFKVQKNKTHHELQNSILKLSNHHMAVIDEIVQKASVGKQMDKIMYPPGDIDKFREVAKKLKGHTHSQIAFARRHRELKGSGLSFESLMNGARHLGTVVSGVKKVAGVAGKAASWVAQNPQLTALGLGAVGYASNKLLSDEPVPDQREQRTDRPRQSTAEIDELLGDTTDEDEPVKRKGSGLAKKMKKINTSSRWII